ncbi:MAG: aminoglycoside phosphotransferase family protein [Bacteroidetes bacterium]|nr:aminoglycoside phosphotransferase family protein [Bacteroidota bacterium]
MQSDLLYRIPSIISYFLIKGNYSGCEPYGSGHIHDTFLIRTGQKEMPDYILQKINNHIFRDIPALMENIQIVTSHIRKRLISIPGSNPDRETLMCIPANNGQLYYQDSQSDYWRVYQYINDSYTYQKVSDVHQAFEAGRIIGRFQALLSDLDANLHETIPGFHDLFKREMEFDKAVMDDPLNRLLNIREEYTFVKAQCDKLREMSDELHTLGIPVRVTHNDTKFNNILFDSDGRALCLIDLDTVMHGYIHYDYGDAIRTLANSASEDEEDIENVHFNHIFYEAFNRSYLQEVESFFTPEERKWLPFSPNYMTFIIGLRFLTDYLNGDKYFKIHRPEHNLKRARVQFRLIRCIEEYQSS